jgi:signal transduction histidine kinase
MRCPRLPVSCPDRIRGSAQGHVQRRSAVRCAVRNVRAFERLTSRRALYLGFGLILAIWAVTGNQLIVGVGRIETQAAAINARYTRAQELLSTVRAQVLLASVFVRDVLLDPIPPGPLEYRAQLRRTYQSIDEALQQYVPILDDPAQTARVDRLRKEIGDFEATMLDVLATDSSQWVTEARDILRTRVVPKRQTVLELSEQVQALNRTTFVTEQAAIAALYSTSQRRIWQILSLALAASLAIAFLAIRYAGRLEDDVQRQRAKEVATTRELQGLSARLITAQEEERRSIARELHDEIGQVLTAVKVELAVAERSIEETGGDTAALKSARGVTEGALQNVRDLSHLLHPAMLDDLGLPEALEWYTRGFSKRHGIAVLFAHQGMSERLPAEVEASAYRIVQEALTNVAKHARTAACRVRLQRVDRSVVLTVEDDGVGFDQAVPQQRATGERGLGLVGIRERAAQARGTFRMESAAGAGTRLTVEFPV